MTGEKRKRVLVVEDDPQVSNALAQRLKHSGFEVVTAASGVEAVHAATNQSIDVMTLDVRLPDMDGFEVASILRDELSTKNIPIIFITGKVDRYFKGRCKDVGARFFIRKPYDADLLLHTLKSVLTDETEMSLAPQGELQSA
jgi:two-component system OmpR family response regulator